MSIDPAWAGTIVVILIAVAGQLFTYGKLTEKMNNLAVNVTKLELKQEREEEKIQTDLSPLPQLVATLSNDVGTLKNYQAGCGEKFIQKSDFHQWQNKVCAHLTELGNDMKEMDRKRDSAREKMMTEYRKILEVMGETKALMAHIKEEKKNADKS